MHYFCGMTLKKYLEQFDKEQLIGQILEIHKNYKDVKAYYKFHLNPDIEKVTEKLKSDLYLCFFPVRGRKIKLAKAKKMVTDYRKFSPPSDYLIEILLAYSSYGFDVYTLKSVNPAVFTHCIKLFEEAIQLVVAEGLQTHYKNRIENYSLKYRDLSRQELTTLYRYIKLLDSAN